MNSYIVGTLVQIDGTFADSQGTPVDPTQVTAEVRLPGGTIVILTGQVQRISTGVYSVDYTPTVGGVHQYRMAGTGAVVAAGEGSFQAVTAFPGG